jgi:hypothetical protein
VKWRTLGILILIVIFLVAGTLYAFLFTERGLRWLTGMTVTLTGISPQAMHIGKLEGDILEGIVYRDLVLENIKGLPQGSRLTIDRLRIHVSDLAWKGLTVNGEGMSLLVPDVGSLHGLIQVQNGQGNLKIQTDRLDVRALLALFPQVKLTQKWGSAFLQNLHIEVNGTIGGEWEGRGDCLLADMRTSLVPINDVQVKVQMKIKSWGLPLFWKGNVQLSGSEQSPVEGAILLHSAQAQWMRTQGKTLAILRDVDVSLPVFRYVPVNSRLKADRVELTKMSWQQGDYRVEWENLRLMMPASDPLVLNGSVFMGLWNVDAFSTQLDAGDIFSGFPVTSMFRKFAGSLQNLDVQLSGPLREPRFDAGGTIPQLVYNGYELKDIPLKATVDFSAHRAMNPWRGEFWWDSGELLSRHTLVHLKESRVVVADGWKNPALFLRGESHIEKTKIAIKITGTRELPEVDLTSQPSHPPERLMIMLATGKAWQGADESLASRTLSPELTKDFVDYFFLNGTGQKIAEHFGLSSISVKLGEKGRGVAVRKELNKQLEVGYGVEQKATEEGKSAEVSHKIGGELQVTDSVTVGVEKEIKNPSETEETLEDPAVPADDRIYFEYKTKF